MVHSANWGGGGAVGPSFTAKLPPDTMVGKALVDAQQDYVPVRVVNLSGQPRTICQGTEVASCEPVESVIHQQHDFTPDYQVIGDDLPEHFKGPPCPKQGGVKCWSTASAP